MAASVGPVVVGTDFSEVAGKALAEAKRLAGLLGVGLAVVHVVEGAAGEAWEESEAAAAWLTAADLRPEDLVVRFGKPWVELARYAGETFPTLVFVGSHGTSGYQPLTIGSTASRVTLHARCPVVVVSPRLAAQSSDGLQERKRNVASRAGAVAIARAEPGTNEPTGETR
jgi:nucleotide-binding universal stress UspA family protein